ncbi:uncharacterized protein N7498_001741, partial [Penicillium cinerascens]
PDDEFINRFQQIFTDIIRQRNGDSRPDSDLNGEMGNPMMPVKYADSEVLGVMSGAHITNDGSRPKGDLKMDKHDLKISNDRTPRNLQDLNFTPSWINPDLMMSLAGHFYTPGSGGRGTVFHSQAGDLHTPTLDLNMTTSLSLSNPMAGTQPTHQPYFDQFNQQYLAQHMAGRNLYGGVESYAPSAFIHRDSGYDTMHESPDGTINDIPVDQASTITLFRGFSAAGAMGGMSCAEDGNFRYNVTLRAPTAMVKHAKEMPVTYLNKGQAYDLAVLDSNPPVVSSELQKYRTFVRVSFEEEEQRSKPAACWQLWKEGRGSNEAHQNGGKLMAVEYVDQLQGKGDDYKQRQVHVEQTSFDGFCVTWTADPVTGPSGCTIPVRFNFLSTDFSLSKGVRGIPVRLCAKTELLSPGEEVGAIREAEVCYCKVKVFRDHGAERKLSNDVAHVTKAVERLKQQIAEAKMGGGFGKRRRGSNSVASIKGPAQPMKASKHKRAWSMSSQYEAPDKISLTDDLQAKLSMLQAMLSSTRTVSVLALGGDDEDDPDLYPIRLSVDSDFVRTEALSRQNTGILQSIESLILPPTGNVSLNSPCMDTTQLASLKNPTIMHRTTSGNTNVSTGFIEAVDIDRKYRPPAERPPKPIACFYIGFRGYGEHPPDYYRAIYLTERTARELMKKISEKQDIDPACVVRIFHMSQNGIRIMVDDDVVRHIPEGQDMVVDIYEGPSPGGSGGSGHIGSSVEIKLTF